MSRKNPDNKPPRIRSIHGGHVNVGDDLESYSMMLSGLAIAQSNLVKAGKDSAMPHFIAIVKELERVHGFRFEIMPDDV